MILNSLLKLPRLFVPVITLISISMNQVHATKAQTHANNHLSFQLKNGLKVILIEDHRAPVATQMIWYKTGSSDENLGKTGIAHVLEHMMFKGTKNLKKGEFSKIVGSIGGKENAFTSNDYTAYFEQFPANNLEKMMDLELERMQHLIIDETEFKKELEVVKEERRMRTDDQPRSLAYEQLLGLAYTTSSYHHPVIGWMQDLNHLTAYDAKQWHQRWYQPHHATLIFMGDFNRFVVKKLIDKKWGRLSLSKKPLMTNITSTSELEPQRFNEKPLSGMKKAILTEDVANAYWIMGFHGINQSNPKKSRALQLLSVILDGYEGAVLSQELVQKQKVATSVGVGFDPISRHQNPLFLVEGVPSQSMEALEKSWWQVIEKIQKESVSEIQLKRAKNQMITERIYGLDSQFNQVLEIGQLDNVGIDFSKQQEWHDNLNKVTTSDIQNVATEFLQPEKSSQVFLFPKLESYKALP